MSNEAVLHDVRNFWNAAVYGTCFYLLGFGIAKAALIVPIVFLCVVLNYGGRWVLRGGFGLLVLTVLLLTGVLPPLDQWHDLLVGAATWSAHPFAAMTQN